MRLYNYIKNNCNLTKSELSIYYNENRILVNNERKNLSYIIKEGDVVTLDGNTINNVPLIYYLYNKPKGLVCTNDLNNKDSYLNQVKIENRIYCIGRLDKDSSGLLILTNDGSYFDELMNPDSHVEKEYLVEVKDPIDNQFIINIQKPIMLDGKLTKESKAYFIDEKHFRIVLTEGKYHQVRRMVKHLNNRVLELKRVRIGEFKIQDLLEGKVKEFRR